MRTINHTPERLLSIIFNYVAKISAANSLNDLLLLMANMGKDMIHADRCTIWLIDRERNELYTTVAHGVDEIRIPYGTGIVGSSIEQGKPIVIEDAYLDPRHNADNDVQTGYRTRSMITVPFRDNENIIIGAYQAINKMTADAVFSDQDLEYLTLAASYAGKSLETFLLHQEIVATQREIISIMGEIGEQRSRETGNHVKRVAAYSYILALGYGLSQEEAMLLRDVSPMHDIGKIAIPDNILNKPGKLTDNEYDVMKNHTLIGQQLLGSSQRKLLRTAAIISEQHHEKWDGSGYPHGLKGEDIHIYGRITAVADVFDALSAERVYKPAWKIDRILALFREERGKHFDPNVIDVFFEKLQELLEVREQLADQ